MFFFNTDWEYQIPMRKWVTSVFKNFHWSILFYSVVLMSAVQQSESVMHIYLAHLFWISFLFRSP